MNAADVGMLSLAALCEAKLARFDLARRKIAEAQERAPEHAVVLARAAAIEARAGRPREALALCERAVARGASRSVLRADEDFESLRQDSAFVRLTAERRSP